MHALHRIRFPRIYLCHISVFRSLSFFASSSLLSFFITPRPLILLCMILLHPVSQYAPPYSGTIRKTTRSKLEGKGEEDRGREGRESSMYKAVRLGTNPGIHFLSKKIVDGK